MLANIPPYSHTIDPDGWVQMVKSFERSSMYLDMELRQVKGKITRHIAKEIAKHSKDGSSHWTDVLDRLCIDLSMEEEEKIGEKLGPSINGLVTDGNAKLCCRGFILSLFKELQPIKLTLNIHKIIRGYSRYAKLKYYRLQSKELKLSRLFMLISDDFQLKSH